MKDVKIYGFFGTTGHTTKYDGMTFPELFKNILRAEYSLKSGRVYLQALQNKFSKKLGIPTVRLHCSHLGDVGASFSTTGVKTNKNNVKVEVDAGGDMTETVFNIIHEIKHAEQQYMLHKYLYHGVVPNDDLSKALLLWKIFEGLDDAIQEDDELDEANYYAQIDELDANMYAFGEIAKLMQKYNIFNNLDLNLYVRCVSSILLASLEYNREGINSPKIAKSIQNFELLVDKAKAGEYGNNVKIAVDEITAEGVDIKAAFEPLTRKLDAIALEIILEDAYFKKMGAKKVNLSDGERINFGDNEVPFDEVVDEFGVEPDSEYARFVEKYIATGDAVYQDFIKDLCFGTQRQ